MMKRIYYIYLLLLCFIGASAISCTKDEVEEDLEILTSERIPGSCRHGGYLGRCYVCKVNAWARKDCKDCGGNEALSCQECPCPYCLTPGHSSQCRGQPGGKGFCMRCQTYVCGCDIKGGTFNCTYCRLEKCVCADECPGACGSRYGVRVVNRHCSCSRVFTRKNSHASGYYMDKDHKDSCVPSLMSYLYYSHGGESSQYTPQFFSAVFRVQHGHSVDKNRIREMMPLYFDITTLDDGNNRMNASSYMNAIREGRVVMVAIFIGTVSSHGKIVDTYHNVLIVGYKGAKVIYLDPNIGVTNECYIDLGKIGYAMEIHDRRMQ